MINPALVWSAALVTSGIAHGVAGWVLLWSIDPDPVPTQPPPEARLQLAAYPVERSEAQRQEPAAQDLTPTEAEGTGITGSVARSSRAEPVAPMAETSAAIRPSTPKTDATAPAGVALAALAAPALSAEAETISAPMTSASPLLAQPTLLQAPASTTAETVAATAAVAQAVAAPGTSAAPVKLAAARLPARPPEGRQAEAVTLQQAAASSPDLPSITAPSAQPPALAAASLPPPAEATTAALAFGKEGPIDPVSLAAFQSFMQPGQISDTAEDVRDGISGLLTAVPCARLQVLFDPADNTLALSGHIPEDNLRQTVLASMQAQMGADIPVRDNLLILPRPQCGALSGIADVGLPESTDQITNPLLVGENTHARSFRYTAGQPLVLALQGADYDAYFYVDFFDAAGNVLHLAPNQYTPLQIVPARAEVPIGSPRPLQPGEPGLYIEVGPPFGQEIAVAFVASHPLSEETRPIIEPADAYLAWLKEQVAAARARHTDFKGEWVYFFVSTAAG